MNCPVCKRSPGSSSYAAMVDIKVMKKGKVETEERKVLVCSSCGIIRFPRDTEDYNAWEESWDMDR